MWEPVATAASPGSLPSLHKPGKGKAILITGKP